MTTPPAALQWSTDNCTVGRTMEVLGERWTMVVLRCAAGHEVTGRRDVATRPGPGIKPFA